MESALKTRYYLKSKGYTEDSSVTSLTVAEFDSGYGTDEGIIAVVVDKCDVCQKEGPVITIDGSYGEYGAGFICLNCAQAAIARFQALVAESMK